MAGEDDIFYRRPDRNGLVSVSRLRQLKRMAPEAGDTKARQLYAELYGAEAGASLPLERVRASIVEAVDELLNYHDNSQ